MFAGRTLLIVTKHGKEQVIAPLLEQALGVNCIVADGFDTDKLGTFTGEVEREDDAHITLRRKCHEGMEAFKCDLAVASEGSFGPHPSVFFAAADDELLMLVDKQNNLEIVSRELSLETNFSSAEICNHEQLEKFLELACFPSHAVIIRKSRNSNEGIIKGITDAYQLFKLSEQYLEKYGRYTIETDMRAMFNPKRMSVIAKAAEKLVEKIKSLCPNCSLPGFGVTEVRKGLPCELCGFGTASTLSHIYICAGCTYTEEKLYPNGVQAENPMYCNICNP